MKPNILVFVTDQLAWKALPFYGDRYAKTPNIDKICQSGTGFDACYCTFPMCQPSRASFWSGIYPHETNVLSNGRRWPVDPLPETVPTLGSVFKDAGYETIHFGKTHDAGALRGFQIVPGPARNTLSKEFEDTEPGTDAWPINYDTRNDIDTAVKASAWLKEASHEKPFLMVADFQNPHDICGWVGSFRDSTPKIDPGVPLPELPENFEFEDIKNRPLPVQYICCSHNRQAHTGEWKDEDFRYYLAAYYHFLNRVDTKIGDVLDALKESGQYDNTLIVFMSDHGDGMAARRRVTKQVDLYEEEVRVPFIFSGPGVLNREKPVTGYPVSSLDLFPTLCGYAGIEKPDTLRGIDLSGVLKGGEAPQREYVASEWHTEWGFTVSPGRMIRTPEYKYTYYIEDDSEELFDMVKDPLEKKNQAKDPEYAGALEHMRALFHKHLEKTGDNFLNLECIVDSQWRSHEVGYAKHRGPAAPEAIEPFPFWLKKPDAV